MAFAIDLTDQQWALIADLFEPPRPRGAPPKVARRQMVNAIRYVARTGCQWRYLPERYGSWGAVWQQWRRWRESGVWARAMVRLAHYIREQNDRDPIPSLVVIDAQTVKGGRFGPTFHRAGGKYGATIGAKRSILIERLGLPLAVRVDSANEHDVASGRLLIADALPGEPRVRTVLADRGYRGLNRTAREHNAHVEIRLPADPDLRFDPIPLAWRVETVFAQLGRWRRLTRCFEGTAESAKAWLEVACVGYMLERSSPERIREWSRPAKHSDRSTLPRKTRRRSRTRRPMVEAA
jgi:putative transposase